MVGAGACAHQRGLTQQTTALAQAPQSHMEVGVATTPAGDLGERVGVQQFLGTERQVTGGWAGEAARKAGIPPWMYDHCAASTALALYLGLGVDEQ